MKIFGLYCTTLKTSHATPAKILSRISIAISRILTKQQPSKALPKVAGTAKKRTEERRLDGDSYTYLEPTTPDWGKYEGCGTTKHQLAVHNASACTRTLF